MLPIFYHKCMQLTVSVFTLILTLKIFITKIIAVQFLRFVFQFTPNFSFCIASCQATPSKCEHHCFSMPQQSVCTCAIGYRLQDDTKCVSGRVTTLLKQTELKAKQFVKFLV